MKKLSHSIVLLLAATVSAAAAAATPVTPPAERLYQWYAVKDMAAPTEPFLMDGEKTRTLADFKGQVVLVNLWATWCTPCLKELPTLDALEEKYAANGLVVLALSTDTLPYKQLRGFVDKQKLELPHLAQDTSGKIYEQLKTRGLPLTYLIDRQGKVRARFAGATEWLEKANTDPIEKLLNEPEAR